MIVVDVGCATHGGDRSIEPLIARFKPKELFGFDPQVYACEFSMGRTKVVLRDVAAWVEDGFVLFIGDSLGARVARFNPGGEAGSRQVKCIDIVRFVEQLPVGTVLKLDAEGSEYPILEKLADTGVDSRLERVLVEWHCPWCGHGIWSHAPACDQMDEAEQAAKELEQRLACPVERWES